MWSIFQKREKTTSDTDYKLTVHANSSLIPSFQIPEPTRSLLWITDEDTSKISSPMEFKIVIKVTSRGVEAEAIDERYNFFSEPSLIWTKFPIEQNNELETQAMYYPSYSGLSPKHRFQYLNWLRDITQETNLSYVFLYYYGLERHMLLGNYDLAVDEVIRLINHHKKSSFRTYAINALILASGYRKKRTL
ncbi:MAG: PBS lyase HEAT domain protein repeat-containing protein [Candidatus Gottesmanbacteria bacterium GW2011_GWA2_47_9]|uniref:PBS lyase HEAT domain protein repeat-containing protein n=1 Tax=Candidatus Gottesmanbacteria bacterium GW2011_GWA2_47_9 TaxID=1618445 RepID=A0A0G1U3P3_9BACT|nr:MAG: PBS lyase HEAT domain protein repeat-containing protein [Candidatus Gottesmanbacteria bacterium GW2011_GWA2_47_9]